MIEYQVVHEQLYSNDVWHTHSVLYTGPDKQIAMITLVSAYKLLAANAKKDSLEYDRIRIIETHEDYI